MSTLRGQGHHGLDALRGVAILLVLLRHSWPEYFGGAGIVGVVAFFTLSGYLITGLLAADVRRHGEVRYGRFYRNRAFRLIPALLFLLIGFVIVEAFLDPSGTRGQILRSVIVALTYTMNIPGFSHGSSNLGHLWTLANEEQFYIVWPLIISLGIRYKKLRLAFALCTAVLVVALLVTVYFAYPSVEKVYWCPSTWTISMLIGAAAQLGKDHISTVLHGRSSTYAALAGGAGLLALALLPDAKGNALVYIFGGSLIALFTVLAVWKLRDCETVPIIGLPFVWLGTISYAAYLWNFPITSWLRDAGFGGGREFAAIALTLLAASVSWLVVEAPINRLRSRFDARLASGTVEAPPGATLDSVHSARAVERSGRSA